MTNLTAKLSIRRILYGAFLFFIPFSQALTINILFPLKISEIFLALIILLEATTGNIVNWKIKRVMGIVTLAFLCATLFSVIINAFYKYPYSLFVGSARITPFIDSLLKFFYILLAFSAFFATRYILKIDNGFVKYFFAGAIAATVYAWYLFFSGALRLPVLLLPGMEKETQTYDIGLGEIIRCGTFKEGNYMGFYLLICGIIALLFKRTKLAIFFFISIITTFSTTSIFCSIIFFIIYSAVKYKRHQLKFLAITVVIVFIITIAITLVPGFRTLLYNKTFGSEETVENVNDVYSKTDRLNTAYIAWEIGLDNPLFGVGPANFGLHYNHYNQLPGFDDFNDKRIPNNIYAEIFSEYGGIALVLFFIFQYLAIKYGGRKSPPIVIAGLIASYVYFFAFPTFTMLFIWVFLGIILA